MIGEVEAHLYKINNITYLIFDTYSSTIPAGLKIQIPVGFRSTTVDISAIGRRDTISDESGLIRISYDQIYIQKEFIEGTLFHISWISNE